MKSRRNATYGCMASLQKRQNRMQVGLIAGIVGRGLSAVRPRRRGASDLFKSVNGLLVGSKPCHEVGVSRLCPRPNKPGQMRDVLKIGNESCVDNQIVYVLLATDRPISPTTNEFGS